MSLSVTNYVEKSVLASYNLRSRADLESECVWLTIGQVTNTVSLAQAKRIVEMLHKAIADYEDGISE